MPDFSGTIEVPQDSVPQEPQPSQDTPQQQDESVQVRPPVVMYLLCEGCGEAFAFEDISPNGGVCSPQCAKEARSY